MENLDKQMERSFELAIFARLFRVRVLGQKRGRPYRAAVEVHRPSAGVGFLVGSGAMRCLRRLFESVSDDPAADGKRKGIARSMKGFYREPLE
jgi:hypothetical protein